MESNVVDAHSEHNNCSNDGTVGIAARDSEQTTKGGGTYSSNADGRSEAYTCIESAKTTKGEVVPHTWEHDTHEDKRTHKGSGSEGSSVPHARDV